MDGWLQVLALFLANASLIFWFRSESRNDWRHMDAKMDSYRTESQSDHRMMLNIIDGIQKEIKDFHGRLCAIEERNRENK